MPGMKRPDCMDPGHSRSHKKIKQIHARATRTSTTFSKTRYLDCTPQNGSYLVGTVASLLLRSGRPPVTRFCRQISSRWSTLEELRNSQTELFEKWKLAIMQANDSDEIYLFAKLAIAALQDFQSINSFTVVFQCFLRLMETQTRPEQVAENYGMLGTAVQVMSSELAEDFEASFASFMKPSLHARQADYEPWVWAPVVRKADPKTAINRLIVHPLGPQIMATSFHIIERQTHSKSFAFLESLVTCAIDSGDDHTPQYIETLREMLHPIKDEDVSTSAVEISLRPLLNTHPGVKVDLKARILNCILETVSENAGNKASQMFFEAMKSVFDLNEVNHVLIETLKLGITSLDPLMLYKHRSWIINLEISRETTSSPAFLGFVLHLSQFNRPLINDIVVNMCLRLWKGVPFPEHSLELLALLAKRDFLGGRRQLDTLTLAQLQDTETWRPYNDFVSASLRVSVVQSALLLLFSIIGRHAAITSEDNLSLLVLQCTRVEDPMVLGTLLSSVAAQMKLSQSACESFLNHVGMILDRRNRHDPDLETLLESIISLLAGLGNHCAALCFEPIEAAIRSLLSSVHEAVRCRAVELLLQYSSAIDTGLGELMLGAKSDPLSFLEDRRGLHARVLSIGAQPLVQERTAECVARWLCALFTDQYTGHWNHVHQALKNICSSEYGSVVARIVQENLFDMQSLKGSHTLLQHPPVVGRGLGDGELVEELTHQLGLRRLYPRSLNQQSHMEQMLKVLDSTVNARQSNDITQLWKCLMEILFDALPSRAKAHLKLAIKEWRTVDWGSAMNSDRCFVSWGGLSRNCLTTVQKIVSSLGNIARSEIPETQRSELFLLAGLMLSERDFSWQASALGIINQTLSGADESFMNDFIGNLRQDDESSALEYPAGNALVASLCTRLIYGRVTGDPRREKCPFLTRTLSRASPQLCNRLLAFTYERFSDTLHRVHHACRETLRAEKDWHQDDRPDVQCGTDSDSADGQQLEDFGHLMDSDAILPPVNKAVGKISASASEESDSSTVQPLEDTRSDQCLHSKTWAVIEFCWRTVGVSILSEDERTLRQMAELLEYFTIRVRAGKFKRRARELVQSITMRYNHDTTTAGLVPSSWAWLEHLLDKIAVSITKEVISSSPVTSDTVGLVEALAKSKRPARWFGKGPESLLAAILKFLTLLEKTNSTHSHPLADALFAHNPEFVRTSLQANLEETFSWLTSAHRSETKLLIARTLCALPLDTTFHSLAASSLINQLTRCPQRVGIQDLDHLSLLLKGAGSVPQLWQLLCITMRGLWLRGPKAVLTGLRDFSTLLPELETKTSPLIEALQTPPADVNSLSTGEGDTREVIDRLSAADLQCPVFQPVFFLSLATIFDRSEPLISRKLCADALIANFTRIAQKGALGETIAETMRSALREALNTDASDVVRQVFLPVAHQASRSLSEFPELYILPPTLYFELFGSSDAVRLSASTALSKTKLGCELPQALLEGFLEPLATLLLNVSLDAGMNVLEFCARNLGWNQYYLLLRRYLLTNTGITSKSQKPLMHGIGRILESFEFEIGSLGRQIHAAAYSQEELDPPDAEDDVIMRSDSEMVDTPEDEGGEKLAEDVEKQIPNDLKPQEEPELIAAIFTTEILPKLQSVIFKPHSKHKLNINARPLLSAWSKLIPRLHLSDQITEYKTFILELVPCLKSSQDLVRSIALRALVNLLDGAPAHFFFFACRRMKALLSKGIHLHVLGYTLSELIPVLSKRWQPGDVTTEDAVLLARISFDEYFGCLSEQKDAEDFTRHSKEAKTRYGTATLKHLCRRIDPITCLGPILSLLLSVSGKENDVENMRQCLRGICTGLVENTVVDRHTLISFILDLTEANFVEIQDRARAIGSTIKTSFVIGKKKRVVRGVKDDIQIRDFQAACLSALAEFGIALLAKLSPGMSDMRPDTLSRIVNLLGECILSVNADVQLSALSMLIIILKRWPKESAVQSSLPAYVKRTLTAMDRSSPKLRNPYSPCIGVLTRLIAVTEGSDVALTFDFNAICSAIKPYMQIHRDDQNPYELIQELLKLEVPCVGIDGLIPVVMETMISSSTSALRARAQTLALCYLSRLDIPPKVFRRHVRFLMSNLGFEHGYGRAAALSALSALVSRLEDTNFFDERTSENMTGALAVYLVNSGEDDGGENTRVASDILVHVVKGPNGGKMMNLICEKWIKSGNLEAQLAGLCACNVILKHRPHPGVVLSHIKSLRASTTELLKECVADSRQEVPQEEQKLGDSWYKLTLVLDLRSRLGRIPMPKGECSAQTEFFGLCMALIDHQHLDIKFKALEEASFHLQKRGADLPPFDAGRACSSVIEVVKSTAAHRFSGLPKAVLTILCHCHTKVVQSNDKELDSEILELVSSLTGFDGIQDTQNTTPDLFRELYSIRAGIAVAFAGAVLKAPAPTDTAARVMIGLLQRVSRSGTLPSEIVARADSLLKKWQNLCGPQKWSLITEELETARQQEVSERKRRKRLLTLTSDPGLLKLQRRQSKIRRRNQRLERLSNSLRMAPFTRGATDKQTRRKR